MIIAVILFAIYGAVDLSLVDFREKEVCPKLFNIPACYIVLFFFVLVLLSHLLSKKNVSKLYFYLFLSIPFFMALMGTISELSGEVVCPRTPGGTPMCYISLGLCSSLFLLKVLEQQVKKSYSFNGNKLS